MDMATHLFANKIIKLVHLSVYMPQPVTQLTSWPQAKVFFVMML